MSYKLRFQTLSVHVTHCMSSVHAMDTALFIPLCELGTLATIIPLDIPSFVCVF